MSSLRPIHPRANNAQSSQSQSPSAGQSSSGSQPAALAPGKADSSQNSSSQSGSSQIGSSGPSAGTVSSPVAGPGSPAAVVSATRTAIVAYAKQFLGNPYVYGGTSLTNGADCSGFTQSVMSHFGIKIPRTADQQAIGYDGTTTKYATAKIISVNNIQPGDLVFYPEDSHVGVVGGWDDDGQLLVIHCASSYNNTVITGLEGFTSIGRPAYYN